MRKLIVIFAIVIVSVISSTVLTQASEDPVKVFLNGNQLSFDVAPIIDRGRTLVPVRTIFEALGAKVEWNAITQTVTIKKDGSTIAIQVGSNKPSVNGREVIIDVPAKIVQRRTLVPLRFVSESLGAEVRWDNQNKSVLIANNNSIEGNKPQIAAEHSIKIQGSSDFTNKTEKALRLLELRSPNSSTIINRYIGMIKQNSYSGMAAYANPPTFLVGDATANSSETWYAGCIAHDSYHSKLYNDYKAKYGSVPDDVWTGQRAEMECLEFQIQVLTEISAPQHEIDYAKSLKGQNWWDKPRDW